MSASPALPSPGSASVAQSNGPPAPSIRKKAPVSIFNSKRKPVKKIPPASSSRPNGATSKIANTSTKTEAAAAQAGNAAAGPPHAEEEGQYVEYPIVVSRSELTRNLRYHVLKLHSRPNESGIIANVNPYDEKQFVRPVRLHRRFAHDKIDVAEQSDAASGVDDKERELMNARRAERQAEREENQKLIAPTGGETGKSQKKKQQKKVEEGRDENNPVKRKRQQLRYEEARPWHLEDFESKNVWVGSYEDPLSEQSILFTVEPGGFQMIPLEKWYKFTQTNKAKTMDSEEVERFFNKKVVQPRWALGTQAENDATRREEHVRRQKERRARQDEDDDRRRYEDNTEYNADRDAADDWGVEGFSDDEGDMELGDMGDEDVKEGAQRLKQNQLEANLAGTGIKDEDKDLDEEERQEAEAKRAEKKKAKRMQRQLRTHERRAEYDDDSDHGEFSEESDSEDSEEESRLEEEQKKEELRKAAQVGGDKSGASSKGTNTPTGRPEKRDPTRLAPALGKRPGSPDVSDMSGNESSRKKVKGLGGRAVSANGASNARSLSREITLGERLWAKSLTDKIAADAIKPRIARTSGSGSGSDTDTSRAGRPKIRLKNSPPGSPHELTPNGSRAGSPAVSGGRAASPQPNGSKPGFPTLAEVRAAIPPGGIEIKSLVGLFKNRLSGRNGEFIGLVKTAGTQDRTTQKIMPKN